MIPRGIIPGIVFGGIATGLLGALLSWGFRAQHDARRFRTRADNLATEAAAAQLRELGYQVTLAGITRDLTRRLDDSVAVVLEAARARPIIRTVVGATASGSTEAQLDSVASGPDSTVYRISDSILSGTVTTWADSASARVDWTAELSLELVHAAAADGRLLVAARSTDPRVVLEVPELAWSPPPPPPGPSRLKWWLFGAAVGVIGWELVR